MSKPNQNPISQVHNLKTFATYTFTLPPDEALISAYLMETGRAGLVSDPKTRAVVREQLRPSKSGKSLTIGDLGVATVPTVRQEAPLRYEDEDEGRELDDDFSFSVQQRPIRRLRR